MSGFKRRILWGTGIVLILLAGLALCTYFIGTRTLLEYAEAFSLLVSDPAPLTDRLMADETCRSP